MKCTAILLLATCLQVSASGYSQKITLSARHVPLEKVFREIKKQTGYSFFFDESWLREAGKVTINVKDALLEEALDICFKDQPVTYSIVGTTVVIKPREQTTGNRLPAVQPPLEIRGVVVSDSTGQPLAGASVKLKGSITGTSTDANGNFLLEVPENGGVLVISYVGYQAREVPVSKSGTIRVVLNRMVTRIEEVVVIGYGTQRKVNLTGAVNTVNTHDITNRPVTSLTNSLQGAIPGMTIVARPGDVGGDIGTINIRGRGNLGSSQPLYVIDGVPVGSDVFARINPSDVESISVLKDAASSAIYGSRAAYGVILVTTKRGSKSEKMSVSYNGYYGTQKALVLPHYLGAYQYALLRNEAAQNAGKADVYSATQLATIKAGNDPDNYPDNDWYKLTLKNTAPLWENELNISGGGRTHYYISGSLMKQGSLEPGKNLTRYSMRSNTESQVSEIFKVGTNLSFIRDEYKMTGGEVNLVSLNRELPMVVNKQSDGNWGTVDAGRIDATHASDNPVRKLAEGGHNENSTNRFLGSLTGSLQPVKGLSIDGLFSYNFSNYVSSVFKNDMNPLVDFFTRQPIAGTGQSNSLSNEWINNYSLLAQAYATYEKNIKEHYGKIMAGTSYENNQRKSISAYRNGFPSNSLNDINAGAQNSVINNGGSSNERAFISYFGRFNYSFKNRYLFEANLRADASSQFAPGHRWGYFPSFSAGWKISDESFMKPVSWVSNLKIRGSWGKLGNVNNVGYYDYLDVLATGPAAILGDNYVNGVWPSSVSNPNLSWEIVNMSNLGLDGALWGNKLGFQVDVYNKTTENILLHLPQPLELGISNPPATNAAKVQNKGIELSLSHNGDIGKLHYAVSGNLAKVWNKILDLHGQDNQISGYYINKEGQAIGSYYMYQSDGLFADSAAILKSAVQGTNTHPGDIRYRDINGDGKIDGSDRTIVGNDVPYFTYGANASVSYKNFDLFVLGQGVTNVKVYLEYEASQAFFNGGGVKEFHLDRWTRANPNPNAAYPRLLISQDNGQNLRTSSFWLFNAAYFRIKMLSLGYTLPASITAKLHIQKLHFYLASNNLFTIRGDKRMKDIDPEIASSNATRGTYPQLKNLSFGINLTF